jgi:NAD-dependent deacetylase
VSAPALDLVVRRLTPAARITVLTGAGVSAASGVPTFRGGDGLWKHFRVEELATPEAFARAPGLVWEWYDWRRQLIAACAPNAAHHVLAEWSLRFPRFTLITQNVDGLHERAGTAGVLRLHGSIWDVGCWQRCAASPHRWRDDTVPFTSRPPTCPHCGGPLRPGVVWFGEALDEHVVAASLAASDCDIFFTIGTSAVVYPAAGLIGHARRAGALTVEINPDSTAASDAVDVVLPTGAEAMLPRLDRQLPPHPLALETPRLRLTPVLPRDTEAMHALWTEPAVRRWLWDDRVIPLATAAGLTAASARDFATYRFGLWSLRTRPADTLAGFCGLARGEAADPELMFGLLPAYWGRGLAVEAARAVLSHAFATVGVARICASTDVPNTRSVRTLASLGMRQEHRDDGCGLLWYSVKAEAYK